jgi:hypothetical protein
VENRGDKWRRLFQSHNGRGGRERVPLGGGLREDMGGHSGGQGGPPRLFSTGGDYQPMPGSKAFFRTVVDPEHYCGSELGKSLDPAPDPKPDPDHIYLIKKMLVRFFKKK